MKENKTEWWRMRAARIDKMKIAKLAKRLKVTESKAVRRAVELMLALTDKKEKANDT